MRARGDGTAANGLCAGIHVRTPKKSALREMAGTKKSIYSLYEYNALFVAKAADLIYLFAVSGVHAISDRVGCMVEGGGKRGDGGGFGTCTHTYNMQRERDGGGGSLGTDRRERELAQVHTHCPHTHEIVFFRGRERKP